MLTERINLIAISGMTRSPLCPKLTVDKLTMTEASIAQRKITVPNFSNPGKAESAERNISMQTKKRNTALAIYTAQ